MLTQARDVFRPKGVGTSEKRGPQNRFMRRGQVLALLQACRLDTSVYGKISYPLFCILSNFGLRISEALDLAAEDFRYIDSDNFFEVKRRKKGDSDDGMSGCVWLGTGEKALLLDLLKTLPRVGPFFRIGSRTAQYLFGYYLARAGLRNIFSPHALRRFTATDMEDAGIPHRIIKMRLGHALSPTETYLSPDRAIQFADMREVLR